MVSDRAVETMQRAVEVLISPADLQRAKSVSAAISPAGDVLPDAVKNVIPWRSHDGTIAGVLTTGPNQLRWPIPQGGVIRHVGFDVRTAPTGGNLTFTITGGETTQAFSLQDGQTTGMVAANLVMPPGAWARVNITSASGAADLALSIHFA